MISTGRNKDIVVLDKNPFIPVGTKFYHIGTNLFGVCVKRTNFTNFDCNCCIFEPHCKLRGSYLVIPGCNDDEREDSTEVYFKPIGK